MKTIELLHNWNNFIVSNYMVIPVSGKEYILHQLRGHDSEVVSLAWCPVRENIINPKSNNDCKLLASAAKEKRIFFWRAGQDGLYEAYTDVPFAPRYFPFFGTLLYLTRMSYILT